MAAEGLNEEMIATYAVTVVGIQRTKNELAKLDMAIRSLRAQSYSTGPGMPSMTVAASATSAKGGGGQIFVTKMDELEGRIQTAVGKTMVMGMDLGKSIQGQALRAAVTPTGIARGTNPGREESGDLIKALRRNVEELKLSTETIFTGWHGWSGGPAYFEYQERGTNGRGGAGKLASKKAGALYRAPNKKKQKLAGQKRVGMGVPAANSLGAAIIPVREFLKRELGALKK